VFFPETPSYAVYRFHQAICEHDGTVAANYIDFEKTVKSLMSQYAEETGEKSEESSFSGVLAQAIVGAMSSPIADRLKTEFIKAVEDPNPNSRIAAFGEIGSTRLTAIILALRRDGNTAHLRFNDQDGKKTEVTLTREDDRWMMTDISGPGVRDSISNAVSDENGTHTEGAKKVKAQRDISELKTSLDRFYLDNGFYPTTDQGLDALVSAPTSGRIPNNYTPGGYIERLLKDPWGNPYVYQSDGSTYILKSYGPDSVESADDIDGSQRE
jgi:type II secretion system protein G